MPAADGGTYSFLISYFRFSTSLLGPPRWLLHLFALSMNGLRYGTPRRIQPVAIRLHVLMDNKRNQSSPEFFLTTRGHEGSIWLSAGYLSSKLPLLECYSSRLVVSLPSSRFHHGTSEVPFKDRTAGLCLFLLYFRHDTRDILYHGTAQGLWGSLLLFECWTFPLLPVYILSQEAASHFSKRVFIFMGWDGSAILSYGFELHSLHNSVEFKFCFPLLKNLIGSNGLYSSSPSYQFRWGWSNPRGRENWHCAVLGNSRQ